MRPGPNQAVYYASKAYVLSLSEAIAAETAGEGVRVSALAPGPVEHPLPRPHGGASARFYRYLVPPASAESVARAGYLGFALGWRVIVPGLVNPFLALAMRIMPHRIVIPIVGWLLKPRGAGQTMLEARPPEQRRSGAGRLTCRAGRAAAAAKKPVCIVLHQENSNPGHVGQWFARNGYALDIRKPRFGDAAARDARRTTAAPSSSAGR